MGRFAQLVIGPAGSGKSTYCHQIQDHCDTIGRIVHVVNLDPAADTFKYQVTFDVRELVTLEEVMDETGLGPNGGLLHCMEYLEDSLDDWLQERLEGYGDEDYIIFDCPGQIELYSHSSVFKSFCDQLKLWGWHVCAVYMLDSQFVTDNAKFIAGAMAALSAMVQLEVAHINVLTKVDLLNEDDRAELDKFLMPDARVLSDELNTTMPGRFRALNGTVATMLDEFSLVSFVPLDISDEDSVQYVLDHVDNSLQFGEDAEVRAGGVNEDAEDEGGEMDDPDLAGLAEMLGPRG